MRKLSVREPKDIMQRMEEESKKHPFLFRLKTELFVFNLKHPMVGPVLTGFVAFACIYTIGNLFISEENKRILYLISLGLGSLCSILYMNRNMKRIAFVSEILNHQIKEEDTQKKESKSEINSERS